MLVLLRRMKTAPLKNIVLGRLINDKNPDVKMLASHLLIKDDISLDLEDLQKLKELYKEKLYDSVKENLCLIFGKHLKIDSDLSSILQSSLNYSYPGIRKAAAMGLAQTLDKKYIPVLKNAYKKEGVKSVKEELEKAINKLNFSNCTEPRKTGER